MRSIAILFVLLASITYAGAQALVVPISAPATTPACSTNFTNFAVSISGVVSGTPITTGLCTFTVTACDSENPPLCSAPTQLNILVVGPVIITTTVMPVGQTNNNYSGKVAAAGGNGGPYAFSGQ